MDSWKKLNNSDNLSEFSSNLQKFILIESGKGLRSKPPGVALPLRRGLTPTQFGHNSDNLLAVQSSHGRAKRSWLLTYKMDRKRG